MRYILLTILSVLAITLHAQTNFNQTMFFGHVGYTIKYMGPNNYVHDTMPNKIIIMQGRGSASICDSNGNLLIVSNGMNLFNADLSTYIENGDSMAEPNWLQENQGSDRYMQTCLILPFTHKKYYHVYVSMSDTQLYKAKHYADTRMDRLYYSVIDMNMNNGKGKVTERMKTLINNRYLMRTAMQACKHANGKDWWVLKIGADSVLGYSVIKYLFTQDTVYSMGTQWLNSSYKGDFGQGQMQFTKDGSKWACSLGNDLKGEVILADFDRCTGILSNIDSIYVLPEMGIPPNYNSLDTINTGMCFSPNGNLLYVSRGLHVVQYDLQNHSQYKVCGIDTFINYFALYIKLGLGPDDKVYISQGHGTSKQMSTIDNPDIVGAGCNFCRKCVRAEGIYNWLTSLSDVPNYDLGKLEPCWPVSNDEIKMMSDELELYPNPTNGKLIIVKGKGKTKELYNAVGQLMQRTKDDEIDVAAFSKGLYYLKCAGQMRKVVVE